jgi:hypothetical protein
MAERKCLRCGVAKGLLSPNYAGGRFPGNPEVDYLCLKCMEGVKLERKKCIGCGVAKGLLSTNCAGGVPTHMPGGHFPGNPEVDYFCEECAAALNREAREQEEELANQKSIAKQSSKIERIKNLASRNTNRVINITLASGAHYEVSHVMLYHGPTVKRAQELQAEARKNLGGVSTGLGFWGSPGWVLGGALALGLLESAASGIAATQGFQQLQEVEEIEQEIRGRGCFIPVGSIDNVDYPIPRLWVTDALSCTSVVSDVEVLNKWRLKRLATETQLVPVWFVHNGEPFIRVKISAGTPLFLAWDQLEQYSVQSVL